MREIKFRGRDEHGDWHYGAFMGVFFDGVVAPIEYANIYDDGMANRVLPDTIGQFTGLKDADGREIYEGDIVRHENCICLVVYNSTRFASFALRKDGWAFDHYFGEAFEASECHVVGNIYDSPELLEKRR